MERIALIIVLAFLLDCLLGDPQNPFHPVRIIGNGIALWVKLREKTQSDTARFVIGALLSAGTVTAVYFLAEAALRPLYGVNYIAGLAFETVLCYFTIAARALKTESMGVYRALESGSVKEAGFRLSRIVGRDTDELTEPDIIRAAVETVAENASDGVIAPILFILLGGAPLGLAYKAVNTLDSMIGYHNEKYEYFGKLAARLDDAANYIPARVSALLMLAATIFTTGNTKRAAKTFIKDRHKHKSPNSAQTEAVCAGALGLRLGGDASYGGKLVHKPEIGENAEEPRIEHIIYANRLMYASALLLIASIISACFIRRFFGV